MAGKYLAVNQADHQLWQSWQRGRDEYAFEALVRPHVRFATDLARRMGCRPDEADDVVQESLAKLAGERGEKPVRVGLRAWIARTVRLQALMLHRSNRRRKRREEVYAGRRQVKAPEPRDADEVEAALKELSEAQREAVVLRYLHDLEYREVAQVLGVSENACRLRVHKAMAELRRRLGREPGTIVAALPLLHGLKGPETLTSAALSSTAAKGGAAALVGVLVMNKVVAISLAVVVAAVAAYVFAFDDDASGSAPDGNAPVEAAGLEGGPQPALEPHVTPADQEEPQPAETEPTPPPTPEGNRNAFIASILDAGGKVAILRDGETDFRRARWVRKGSAIPEGELIGVEIREKSLGVLLDVLDAIEGIRTLRIEADRGSNVLDDENLNTLLGAVDLHELDIRRCNISDDGLEALALQRHLRYLHISNLRISNEGLRHVAGLNELEEIDIGDNKITDDGLAHLSGLTSLREIELGETQITDAGFAHLKNLQLEKIVMRESRDVSGHGVKHLDLSRLEEFDVDETGSIDDSVMEALKHAPRLKDLVVKETKVTDKGLEHIGHVRSLEELDVNDTKVTSKGIAHLVGLPKLRHLNLAETAVDDDAIPHLIRMTQLKHLELRETRITKEGIARLRAALPDCRVRDD